MPLLHFTPKGPAEGSFKKEVLFELSWIDKNEPTVQMYLTDKASGCYSQRLGFSCGLRLQVCLTPEGRRLNCGIVGLNQLRVGYLGISRKGKISSSQPVGCDPFEGGTTLLQGSHIRYPILGAEVTLSTKRYTSEIYIMIHNSKVTVMK